MASSLSNLVNNVTAKVHKNKYKYCDWRQFVKL